MMFLAVGCICPKGFTEWHKYVTHSLLLWMQIDVLEVDGVYYGMLILENIYMTSDIVSFPNKRYNCFFYVFYHACLGAVVIGNLILVLFPNMPLLY